MRLIWLILVLLIPSDLWATFDYSHYKEFDNRPIREITFVGNNATKEITITREMELRVGRPFTVAALERGLQNLQNRGIFGSVEATVEAQGDSVAVEYTFSEMPSYIPYIAVKYTEQNNFSVGPAISSVNLFGRAIRLSGRALFGGTTQLIIDFSYPWITGNHVSLDLDANHIIREDPLNDFEETSDELTPWLGRFIGVKGRIRGMAGYFHMGSDKDGVTISSSNNDHYFRLGFAIGYDSRDSWRNPHVGWQHEVELIGNVGTSTFLGTNFDFRRYQPIARGHQMFLGSLTSLRTGTVDEDVPQWIEYRMGGANSIRGYDIEVLGKELYGKNQQIFMVEYQYTLLPLKAYKFLKWSAALGLQLAGFADFGSAWSTQDEFENRDRWKLGYGIGLRLLVPGTEMTRFDVGFDPHGNVFFHFGNWAKWTAQRFRLR